MQWSDEGIIIGTRRHGETSLIVELMTPAAHEAETVSYTHLTLPTSDLV